MKAYIYSMGLLLGVLTSCASMEVLSFEQLAPATVSYPAEIGTVAVINTLPEPASPKDGMITIGELPASGKSVAEELAGALADSKYFNRVMICDSVVKPSSETGIFSKEEIQDLAAGLHADLIFSLDRVLLNTQKAEVFYPGFPVSFPVVRMKVTPVLSIYSPVRERPIQVVTVSDSLEWDVELLSSDAQLQQEGARVAASKLTKALVPYWSVVDRIYYSGGCVEMRDADVYIKENNWEGACKQWEALYNRTKSRKQKFRAAFNSALGYEMIGNTDLALQWLEKAKAEVWTGTEEEQVLKFYEAQLTTRVKELMYLNSQMNRFDNNF